MHEAAWRCGIQRNRTNRMPSPQYGFYSCDSPTRGNRVHRAAVRADRPPASLPRTACTTPLVLPRPRAGTMISCHLPRSGVFNPHPPDWFWLPSLRMGGAGGAHRHPLPGNRRSKGGRGRGAQAHAHKAGKARPADGSRALPDPSRYGPIRTAQRGPRRVVIACALV